MEFEDRPDLVIYLLSQKCLNACYIQNDELACFFGLPRAELGEICQDLHDQLIEEHKKNELFGIIKLKYG